jgi:peptide/nickel transport system substrate-binding protein
MVRKLLFGLLILTLIAVPLFAAACEEEVTPPAEEEEEQPPAEEEEEVEGDWWDEFGEPQYGGTITVRAQQIDTFSLDPGNMLGLLWTQFLEGLFFMDWTLDRDIYDYKTQFIPEEYNRGMLVESWETPDAQTVVLNIRKGIYWEDKPPVNGREFTAYDVQFHFDRLMGTGSGFTEPNPFYMSTLAPFERVVATDDYTVEFRLKNPSALGIDKVLAIGTYTIAAPEMVEFYEENDWHNAVGTGPWLLTDFVQSTSITYSANPDYWGYDERHPENQLPYADELKYLAIGDTATAAAAIRSGQVDLIVDQMGGLSWQQAASIAETNPEILQALWPMDGMCVEMRVDHEPFTDIRVRKALQMTIDREAIAQTYYGGTVEGVPTGMISPFIKDYAFTYEEWPDELKEEYSYNVDGARELLAETQWAGGFSTSCITAAHYDITLLEAVQGYFSAIGVEMEIEVYDMPVYASICNAGENEQMVYADSAAMVSSPLNAITRRNTAVSPQDYTHHNDPHYIELAAALEASASTDEARQIFKEIERYALEQHWVISLTPNAVFIAWQPWILGYSGELVHSPTAKSEVFARLWVDQVLKESLGH